MKPTVNPRSKDRIHKRDPFQGDVFLKQEGFQPVSAVDLSYGGLAFSTQHQMELEQEIDLVMLNKSVTVSGQVRSKVFESNQWRVGVSFSEPQVEVVDVILALGQEQEK